MALRSREREFASLGQVVFLQDGVPVLGEHLWFYLSLGSERLRENLLEDLLLISRAFAESLDQ